jgi:AMP-activated protein kinase-like protein
VRFSLLVCLALAACRPPGYGKGGGDDGAPDAGRADAAIDAAATSCDHGFRLDGHGSASSVWLTGTFTMWGGDPAHGAIALALGTDGGWTVTHTFDVGVHQYKFIVDGSSWIPDPANPNTIDDGFGGKNSVYTCAP